MKKTALITGINGMDGSHLADLLLTKNYKIYGVERRSSSKNRIKKILSDDEQKTWLISLISESIKLKKLK